MNNVDPVTFEITDHLGIITLDLPPGNYLPIPGFIPLGVFEQWTGQNDLKGLIIKGEGKNFSAGGNLGQIFKASRKSSDIQRLMDEGTLLLNRIQDLDIPVIAAINNICFGGGLEIALACHMRVASENALFAFPEVNQNLMPGMGGTYRLPGLIGHQKALNMILGGDMVNAAAGKEMGLIDYIAPKNQAFEFSLNLMHKMTNDRPLKVIKSIMRSLGNVRTFGREMAMAEETRLFCSLATDEAERRKTEEA
ncbi:MAG: enoyl-CoA hydratase/isomerase family protein [Bacteroidota bacterium]